MKKTGINLIPDIVNPSPDYYCTWQTQLYATSDGKPVKQRQIICEKSLFDTDKPYGWAYFYEKVRKDLIFVMDDSWDVPLDGDEAYYGSLILSKEKFPSFYGDSEDPMKKLCDEIHKIGWKGLGGWMCAQESKLFFDGKDSDEYWINKLKKCQESGMNFLKLDWGEKADSFEFRERIVQLAEEYAHGVIIENSIVQDVISFSDVFRTYDVPAIMSIPMTIEKLINCLQGKKTVTDAMGLINCEDEVYIAAAGGFTMGVMRHPYSGNLPDGRADMSFPSCHRNLKSKMKEVERAVNWHKIAPAYGIGGEISISNKILEDYWEFKNTDEEIESWWFGHELIKDCVKNNVLTKHARSGISRGVDFPEVQADECGHIPYVVAARNPNGAISIATLGRTLGRKYFIPRCNVKVQCKDAEVFGIFGIYKNLILDMEQNFDKVSILMQDLAGGDVFDITDAVQSNNDNCLIIPGDIIEYIGTSQQANEDTSEPGVVIKILK